MVGRMGIRVSQAKQLGTRRRESGREAALFEALAALKIFFLHFSCSGQPVAISQFLPRKIPRPCGREKKRDRKRGAASLLVLTCEAGQKHVRVAAEREITGRVVGWVFEGAAEEWARAKEGPAWHAHEAQKLPKLQCHTARCIGCSSCYLTLPHPPQLPSDIARRIAYLGLLSIINTFLVDLHHLTLFQLARRICTSCSHHKHVV